MSAAAGAQSVDSEVAPKQAAPELPFVVSARSDEALRGQAERLLEHLQQLPELEALDVAFSLAGRAKFERRAVLLCEGRGELIEGLGALARDEPSGEVVRSEGPEEGSGPLAFLFTGQGAQRIGMGQELYEAFPAFARAFDEVCAGLDLHLESPIREVIRGGESAAGERLDRTEFTQAGLFALEVALYRLMEGWGLRPDFLLGHSIGELAAAHVAGVLALEDACALVAARGRLMQALEGGGAMVSLEASEEEVRETLAGREHEVALAAVNGLVRAVVLSGDEAAVLECARVWAERGRKTKRLRVSHAFHSPRMAAMLGEVRRVAEGLSFSRPQIPIVSNLTGEFASEEELCSAEYWVRHAREPVRFLDGVRRLAAAGVRSFLELGPDGVLSAMCEACLAPEGEDLGDTRALAARPIAALPALRSEHPDAKALLRALAGLWVQGTSVDCSAVFEARPAGRVPLPTYAFQRRHYWLQTGGFGAGDLEAAGLLAADHPLLGATLARAGAGEVLLTGRLSLEGLPWLADYTARAGGLLPGTMLLELALRAGEEVECRRLQTLEVRSPLVLPQEGGLQLQVAVGAPAESGGRTVSVYARPESLGELAEAESWTCHAEGLIEVGGPTAQDQEQARALAEQEWPPQGAVALDVEEMYDLAVAQGIDYGPLFQTLRGVWRRDGEVFAEVALAEEQRTESGRFGLHPAPAGGRAAHARGRPPGWRGCWCCADAVCVAGCGVVWWWCGWFAGEVVWCGGWGWVGWC